MMIRGSNQGFDVSETWFIEITPYILGDNLYLEIRWIDKQKGSTIKELLLNVKEGVC